jgi:hypothetical protein
MIKNKTARGVKTAHRDLESSPQNRRGATSVTVSRLSNRSKNTKVRGKSGQNIEVFSDNPVLPITRA